MAKREVDFTVSGHGTVYILTPQSERGKKWAKEHLPDVQPWQMIGKGIAVEHRFIRDIVEGFLGDGLTATRL